MEAYLIVRYFSDWDEETTSVIAVFTDESAAKKCLEKCKKETEKMIANNVKHAECVSYELEVVDLNPTEADIW